MKNILEDLNEVKVGIIVNEIGKISIDGISLSNPNIPMKELNNGSIFCACIKDNFIQALLEFKKYEMDYLLIEASGISDPANIDKMLALVNKDNYYEYLGNVCIIDGVYFTRLMKVYPVIEKQILSADLILLNKVDLITENDILEIKKTILEHRAEVNIMESCFCKVTFHEIIAQMKKAKGYDETSLNTPENKPSSFCGEYEGSISYEGFLEFLESIKKESVRIKGYAKLNGQNYRVNVVSNTVEINEFNESLESSKLVFISYLGTRYLSKILKLWKGFIGSPLNLR
jgi:G3E family GTPase